MHLSIPEQRYVTTVKDNSRGPPPDFANPAFLTGVQVGTLSALDVIEASGIAASRNNSGVFWTHNDNMGDNKLFAINESGTLLGTYTVGTGASDPEDIAVGPGPENGTDYLYWGDIGDNGNVRPSIFVKRVKEPNVTWNQSHESKTLTGVDVITLQYPGGADAPSHKDSETLMVDTNADIYLMTKRTGVGRLYKAAYPQSTTATITMTYEGNMPWGGSTGGDLSPDGSLVVIRRYTGSNPQASVWYRPPGKNLSEAFSGTQYNVALRSEPQGEAICWCANGRHLYAVSEKAGGPNDIPIWFYKRNVEVYPPVNLTATTLAKDTIQLSWDMGDNATHTYIERNNVSPWSFGTGTIIYNGTEQIYNDTGLASNTTYYYQAWSYDDLDEYWSTEFAEAHNTTLPNSPPQISLESPADGMQLIPPNPTLGVTLFDLDNDLLEITFWTNATGTWQELGANNSVPNGRYFQQTSMFTLAEKDYWWSVKVTDGESWTNLTFSFVTRNLTL
jgi:hypothetical protein